MTNVRCGRRSCIVRCGILYVLIFCGICTCYVLSILLLVSINTRCELYITFIVLLLFLPFFCAGVHAFLTHIRDRLQISNSDPIKMFIAVFFLSFAVLFSSIIAAYEEVMGQECTPPDFRGKFGRFLWIFAVIISAIMLLTIIGITWQEFQRTLHIQKLNKNKVDYWRAFDAYLKARHTIIMDAFSGGSKDVIAWSLINEFCLELEETLAFRKSDRYFVLGEFNGVSRRNIMQESYTPYYENIQNSIIPLTTWEGSLDHIDVAIPI